MNNQTRTAQLAEEIKKLAETHADTIKALPTKGPQGGHNARTISGWSAPGNSAITKAAKMAGIATMDWWDGHLPTPSTAIPSCIAHEARIAYDRIFSA